MTSFLARPASRGLAASLSLGLTLSAALVGCDGGRDTTADAVVTVTEPSAASSSSSSAAAPTEGAATPTATPTAEEKPAAEAPAAATAAEGWGTLKGRVVFSGDAPAPKVLVAKGDTGVKDGAFCSKNEIDSQRLVVNSGNKGVRYAIVYLPKPTAVNKDAEAAAKTAQVIFDQKNCTFDPHVLATMKGTTVDIKSSDAVGHNANAVGLLYNKFNLPTQPNSSTPWPTKNAEPRPGKIGCDIHPWMEAYWFVLGNPYFAVTDADGNFEIKNVPAGEQKVVVWAEALGPGYITPTSGEAIAIKAGGETTKDFTLDAAKVK